jgi:hypothetical protein
MAAVMPTVAAASLGPAPETMLISLIESSCIRFPFSNPAKVGIAYIYSFSERKLGGTNACADGFIFRSWRNAALSLI